MQTLISSDAGMAGTANPVHNPMARTADVGRITSPAPALMPLVVDRPAPRRASFFDRLPWFSGRRQLSLRQLRQELIDAAAATPDGVVARVKMLDRLNADLAIAENAWHPQAGPDITWPLEIWEARYRGIKALLLSKTH